MPYTTGTTPMVLVPAIQSAEQDKRGRFREIFCEVLEARGDSVPDYRPCENALTHVGNEPAGTGKPVKLGQSTRRLVIAGVPGVGWDCFSKWLDLQNTIPKHLRQFDYDEIAYYSLSTFPDPERISSVLHSSYKKLGKVDARNDSQVIFYDQFIDAVD